MVVGTWVLFKGKYTIKLTPKDLIPNTTIFKRIFKIGFPSAIERSLHSLGIVIFTGIVSILGTTAIAAYGIGSKILMMVLIPGMGLSMAVMTFAGQNIGAKKIERAEQGNQFSLIWGFIILSFIGIITFFFAKPLVSFFIPGEAEVIAIATTFVKVISFAFGFVVFGVVVAGIYKAAGRTWLSLMIGISQIFFLVLTSVILINYGFSETGLWVAYLISFVASGFLALLIYSSGNWKNNKIKH
jgi:Na+-driven multidrug efflux pump